MTTPRFPNHHHTLNRCMGLYEHMRHDRADYNRWLAAARRRTERVKKNLATNSRV